MVQKGPHFSRFKVSGGSSGHTLGRPPMVKVTCSEVGVVQGSAIENLPKKNRNCLRLDHFLLTSTVLPVPSKTLAFAASQPGELWGSQLLGCPHRCLARLSRRGSFL